MEGERRSTDSVQSRWRFMGESIPKAEIVYFCQMIIVFVIVVAAIVNITIKNGSNELWVSLLSGCTGYVLPNPTMKKI